MWVMIKLNGYKWGIIMLIDYSVPSRSLAPRLEGEWVASGAVTETLMQCA
jgi:hypothetical protein